MPFIRELEQTLTSDPQYNHEYLWFLGMAKFNEMAPKLILGERSPALLEGRVSGYVPTLAVMSCHGFVFNAVLLRRCGGAVG